MEQTQEHRSTREIFKLVKPYFRLKLGKYTHQRVSGDWHFHGLAFVLEEMTYVFGFNIGFFRKDVPQGYDVVGMNVLVRTNGMGKKLRARFNDFFAEALDGWHFNTDTYTSFRGEIGTEYGRYKALDEFNSEQEIVDFLKESIDGLHAIYTKIQENPDSIFDDVMRASFPWHDTILDVCDDVLNTDLTEKS